MNDGKKSAPKRGPEQLPLAFAYRASSGRDDLLINARMETAVGLVDSWPDWPSPVVIITGPPGSGKSHLAAVWREASNAADIVPESGAQTSQTAATRPVIFEDVDRTAYSETELFHVINSVRQNGSAILMTARTWPATWGIDLADLKSRLRAATMVEIGEPDEDHLQQLIVKLFADRQLHVDDRLVGYIVQRIDRSFEAAQAVVERIDQMALARRAKVTRQLAGQAITELGFSASET
ncbi:DnaA regulatory inactivator HdaA [Rhizobium halophytocola]|uniref:Chromosomal replication initiation ATPase DnaA n=1 Tax=Rhizobium halophytocola TaxID=735519 RepID=A0ABS4DYE6_9HYPH|nr:DnaA regulatory inactivator HdaA [Rhizobium halophytocola]MBP1850716.1 chromosomal replication initiation ATPase DnaA [Rhizobium halophytocola]